MIVLLWATLWVLAYVALAAVLYVHREDTWMRVGRWFGYWIRPFDMLADRRRWRWQKRAPCGRQAFADLTPDAQAALIDAIARFREDEGGETR